VHPLADDRGSEVLCRRVKTTEPRPVSERCSSEESQLWRLTNLS
jgi:hypothetical protein